MLLDADSNKNPKRLCWLKLRAHLYHRVFNSYRPIPIETLHSDDGEDTVVNFLFKRDPLPIVSRLYNDFSTLLNSKRKRNELFINFKSRFATRTSRNYTPRSSIFLPSSIASIMFLANANVGDSQSVLLLSAVFVKATMSVTADLTKDDKINFQEYKLIITVIQQCYNGSQTLYCVP